MHINTIAADLNTLDEPHEEEVVVRKILQAVPSKYKKITLSIETPLDLETLSVEELVEQLKAVEHHRDMMIAPPSSTTKLLLMEEEWLALMKLR